MSKDKINLKTTLCHWGTASFNDLLVGDIMSLKPGALPLQQGLMQGDMASELPDKVTVISSGASDAEVVTRLGIFFTEIISGCSCGDDPATLNGYCEMQLTIDKLTGAAAFRVVD